MKKTIQALLILLLFLSPALHAQYTTPGDDLVITLDFLVENSDGVVTEDEGEYFINDALTISATDTFEITGNHTIRIAAGVRLTVFGALLSVAEPGDQIVFTSIGTNNPDDNFESIRFEDAEEALFINTTIQYGFGVRLISTPAVFQECTISHHAAGTNFSAAVNYSNIGPLIQNCTFEGNAWAAISSGANVAASPVIIGNTFIGNGTANTNRPQLNLGPGVDGEPIIIRDNMIIGDPEFTQVGGLALANSFNVPFTTAEVVNNIIIDNRYGITVQGGNTAPEIRGNYIRGNNTQGNPNLGGSGINIIGSASNSPVIRDNIIADNLWGITIQNNAVPDVGTADNPGGNVFFDNENGGQIYALFNNTPGPITAIANYWGTNDENTAESYIFPQPGDGSLGEVTFLPIQTLNPIITEFVFDEEDNPGLNESVSGQIDLDAFEITFNLPSGVDISSLTPTISLPLGAEVQPESGEIVDFSDPVVFTVEVPHGDAQEWTVIVTQDEEAFASVQLIHNAADPALSLVDVYVNGELFRESFAFRTATQFLDVPAETELEIDVTLHDSPEVIYSVTVELITNETYTMIAQGVTDPSEFALNPDGVPTDFFIDLLVGTDNVAEEGNVDFFIYHGATDAPTVDVVARDVLTLAEDLFYTENTDFLSVPADSYILDIIPSGSNEPAFVFNADLSPLSGESAVVLASGFLNSDANQGGLPFELFAVLPNGDVLQLDNITSVHEGDDVPTEVALSPNYPNPFNPTTAISYQLPEQTDVRLDVFNIQGQRVATLVNGPQSAGTHNVTFDASRLASGVYLYRLTTGTTVLTRKMMLVK